MAQLKFYRGLFEKYDASTHADGIYFATDTQEILLNNKRYGGVASDASALQAAIVKAEFNAATSEAAATLTLTSKNDVSQTITLPSVAASNGVNVSVGDNGVYTVDLKLDANTNNLLSNSANGLLALASLEYVPASDDTTARLQLKSGDKVISNLDATPFVKDGILDSVKIEDGKIVFTWNTDANKTATEIALNDIFNPYTIGNGLGYESSTNTLYTKIKEGDEYITVDGDGIHATELVGVMDASIVANQSAIAVLNGTADESGSVAKAVADAKDELKGTADDTSANETLAGVKKYAQEYADAAVENAVDGLEKIAVDSSTPTYITVADATSEGVHTYSVSAQTATLVSTLGMKFKNNQWVAGSAEGAVDGLATAADVATKIVNDEKVIAGALNDLNTRSLASDASIAKLETALEWNNVTA